MKVVYFNFTSTLGVVRIHFQTNPANQDSSENLFFFDFVMPLKHFLIPKTLDGLKITKGRGVDLCLCGSRLLDTFFQGLHESCNAIENTNLCHSMNIAHAESNLLPMRSSHEKRELRVATSLAATEVAEIVGLHLRITLGQKLLDHESL